MMTKRNDMDAGYPGAVPRRVPAAVAPSRNVAVVTDQPATASPTDADRLRADNERLRGELASLRTELWTARDTVLGLTAEIGTLRAERAEVDSLVHQLRVELGRLAHVEHSLTYRIGDTVVKPLKVARRLAR